MLRGHVKHYLTSEGIEFFQTWIEKVRSAMSQCEGFIRLEYSKDTEDPSCLNILVEFANEETANRWGTSKEHDSLVDGLDPYRTKDWQVAKVILPSKGAPEPALTWITIPARIKVSADPKA